MVALGYDEQDSGEGAGLRAPDGFYDGRGPSKPTAGRFANAWRDFSGQTELEEEARRRKRQLIASARYRLSQAIESSDIDAGITAAEDVQHIGEKLPNDLQLRLLELACDLPGVARFARALSICIDGDFTLDEYSFARVVGKLMCRDAPHAQVRCLLNLGLPANSDPLELVPKEADKEADRKACFLGTEHIDEGELSEHDIAAIGKEGRSSASADKPPKVLSMSGPAEAGLGHLRGHYKRAPACPQLLRNKRPVYTLPSKKYPAHAYYYQQAPHTNDPEWPSGWYLGSEVGGGGDTYAYCDQDAKYPPSGKWRFRSMEKSKKGQKKEWRSVIVNFEEVKQSAAVIVGDEAARAALETVDLKRLVGRLVPTTDPEAARYFSHFFTLMHLEHLAEVSSFRARLRFRSVDELVRFGICVKDLRVESAKPPRADRRHQALPGWPEHVAQRVNFRLPRSVRGENLRLSRGESILVSTGHPLTSRIAEATVHDVDVRTRTFAVNIDGKLPMNYFDLKFRIDLWTHRTSFERMMTALLQFITMEKTRICDMLIAAGVGKVDLAVLGGDGFNADKSKLVGGIKGEGQPGEEDKADEEAVAAESGEKDETEKAGESGNVDEVENDNKDGSNEETMSKPVEKVAPDSDVVDILDDDVAEENGDEKEDKDGDDVPMEDDVMLIADDDEEPMVSDQPEQEEKMSVEITDVQPPAPGSPSHEKTAEDMIKEKTMLVADEVAGEVLDERLREAEDEVQSMTGLSDAQKNAIVNAMAKRLTIVQGPPGTGKTHTSVHILSMWARTMQFKPLLATSHCNIAVDNIAEGLAKNGVKVCRIGRTERVREHLEKVCLDHQVQAEVKLRLEEAIEKGEESELEDLEDEPEEDDEEARAAWEKQLERHRRRRDWLQRQSDTCRHQLMEGADVLCCTTINAGSAALEKFKFHAILIDEVAQATETSTLVPIVCRGAQQLVLCGDHCQLPPSVVSREAELRGLSLSMYSRLVEAGVPFRFLDTQYRAHPMLMEFSADCIYQGKLKHGVTGEARPRPKGVPWPSAECPAAFFECDVEEHLDGESKANENEAKAVLKLVKDVMSHGQLELSDIGIVTPYKGQVRTLRRVIHSELPEAVDSKELEIASVDNFQGREKELIVFSAVRCNSHGGVGFLADWRRLNVMITRARSGLVVFGNAATLICDRHWKVWLEYTERQGGCAEGTVHSALGSVVETGKGKGKGHLEEDIRKYTATVSEERLTTLVENLQKAGKSGKKDLPPDFDPLAGSRKTLAALAKKRRLAELEVEIEEEWDDIRGEFVPVGTALTSKDQKKKQKKAKQPKVYPEDDMWDATEAWDDSWWDESDLGYKGEAPWATDTLKALARPKKKGKSTRKVA